MGDKPLPRVANIDADSPEGKAVGNQRAEIFRAEYLPIVQPFPGAKELLSCMREQGLILAVASSAKATELDSLLQLFDGEQFIQVKTNPTMSITQKLIQTSSMLPYIVSAAEQKR